MRWVDAAGAVSPEATTTGLHFQAPLDGMTLADARPRPPGIDVLWYETAPGRRARTSLGSGRLMAASLRADGSLDFASRVAVVDADVEYGHLRDHKEPRLVGGDLASVFLDAGAKGECEAIRVLPSLARLSPAPAACAVAPDRLAGALDPADLAGLDRLRAERPRRAFGQPGTDFGLAAWAGDRAYYLAGDELRSASRDGAPRDEPPPFAARRARVAWGALTPDGEGVAFAGGRVVHVDARAFPPAVERGPLAAGALPGVVDAAEIPADRRRAVRIGASFRLARGPRVRVWPPDAGGRAPVVSPDASVLVGGARVGTALDFAGDVLTVSSVGPAGDAARLAVLAPAPVRVGFDACERAEGGALVAGVSAADPGVVVAFTLSAAGTLGPVQRVPLPVRPGELAVRLVPLPAGGALLLDLARRHVVWLDDDARPLGAAEWPARESDAACLDGRPMRLAVPGPAPGQMVPVPDVAEGACVIGDPVWGPDGNLRWIGASVVGLDSYADVASIHLLPATAPAVAPVAAPLPGGAPAATPARCPPDMVSIAGEFCVDRFEDTIVDARTGERLSPDYPTTPGLLEFALAEWATGRERIGNLHARAFPLPYLSPARLGDHPSPLAVSRLGARPNGYVTGVVAEAACAAAGKRLCTLDEFETACRGEADTPFPYGDTYQDGVCNVFREQHPAALLHDNASVGHLDPRLNRVSWKGRPLLQRTGASPACRSRWGDDAVYDMVGNIDEWVDEGAGAFAGGFYSRSTRQGCEAVVTAHPKSYLDYSTGVRCCRDCAHPPARAGGIGVRLSPPELVPGGKAA